MYSYSHSDYLKVEGYKVGNQSLNYYGFYSLGFGALILDTDLDSGLSKRLDLNKAIARDVL